MDKSPVGTGHRFEFLNEEQQLHVDLMQEIVLSLRDTPLVLKGGTALLLAYGLDRFSEDLDFDSEKRLNLESKLKTVAEKFSNSQIERIKQFSKDINSPESRFIKAFE